MKTSELCPPGVLPIIDAYDDIRHDYFADHINIPIYDVETTDVRDLQTELSASDTPLPASTSSDL